MLDRSSHPEALPYLRERMVEEQLRGRGIRDPRVLAAMGKVRAKSSFPAKTW